jgi:hypothetical protein
VQLLFTFKLDENLKNSIILITLLTAVLLLIEKCWKLFLDAFTITQSMLLLYLSISYADENFWLISLPILVTLNYFTIPMLASHYYVPKQELFSVALIFQSFFLINAFF